MQPPVAWTEMTRYLIDGRHISLQQADGATRIVRGLLSALPGKVSPGEEVLLLASDEAAFELGDEFGLETCACGFPATTFASMVQTAGVISGIKPDAFFYPQYDLPLLSGPVPSIAFVHDVTPVTFRDYFGRRKLRWRNAVSAAVLASTCARASFVLTPSMATLEQLSNMTGGLSGRVRIARPGPSVRKLQPPTRSRFRHRFVYLGNHRPHKQIPMLIRAFSLLRREVPEAELILLGRPDPRFLEVVRLVAEGRAPGVQLMSGLTDEQVDEILASARALVFPSVGEGFGLPVLEAYRVKTPAIVARAGSLPEVAGDAGLTVTAGDTAAWAVAMRRIMDDDALWSRLSRATTTVYGRFSWSSAADVLMTTLRDAAALGEGEGGSATGYGGA